MKKQTYDCISKVIKRLNFSGKAVHNCNLLRKTTAKDQWDILRIKTEIYNRKKLLRTTISLNKNYTNSL